MSPGGRFSVPEMGSSPLLCVACMTASGQSTSPPSVTAPRTPLLFCDTSAVQVPDRGSPDEVVTHVQSLNYVSAEELVPMLRPLMDNNGHLAAAPTSNSLILSDNASNIQRMLAIIKRVDKNTEQEIEVIPLQYALGSEIVRLLDRLWPQNAENAGSRISVGVDALPQQVRQGVLQGDHDHHAGCAP